MPSAAKALLFPSGFELVAAAHDIGKVSPTFVQKIKRACSEGEHNIPSFDGVDSDFERRWGGHAGVSELTAKAAGAPELIPRILGQHHGSVAPVGGYCTRHHLHGGTPWLNERLRLLSELRSEFDVDWPPVEQSHQVLALSGLTTVADWIGSGKHFHDPAEDWRSKIDISISESGFDAPAYRKGLSFSEVFDFDPREEQSALIHAIKQPGVYALEAPMGVGKTEAALFAAYRLLTAGSASGVYFALPTRMTSDRIFTRFESFLDRILAAPIARKLVHSHAWMKSAEFGEDAQPGGEWFDQRKRGLLARFGVGTIDQALMAAMNVKHGFVRAFGLAGKVVILDEVHSYDAYTGTILAELISLLRELHCTVIILSATLNTRQRSSFIGSHESNEYPLISGSAKDDIPFAIPVRSKSDNLVTLTWVKHHDALVEEALRRAECGQQILWIENSVADAQSIYSSLAARSAQIGVEHGLLHSRFTPLHREQKEARWTTIFGKSAPHRSDRGRILVGTQVLEQSLDLDADYMVTRFAPTDMLLQRMGRLWRHSETPRPSAAKREFAIIAPTLEQILNDTPASFKRTLSVYSPYVLARTLEVWEGRDRIRLPSEIRELIDKTYKDRVESGQWEQLLLRLNRRRRELTGVAESTLSLGGSTLSEIHAETRWRNVETCQLLLLQQFIVRSKETELRTLDQHKITIPLRQSGKMSRDDHRRTAVELHQHILTVPAHVPLPYCKRETLARAGLGAFLYLGDPTVDESLVKVALVDDSTYIYDIAGGASTQSEVRYDQKFGFRTMTDLMQ